MQSLHMQLRLNVLAAYNGLFVISIAATNTSLLYSCGHYVLGMENILSMVPVQ